MLYPKNQTAQLEKGLFEKPTSEYRAAPFWAWNTRLREEELLRQIDEFQKMGFGGFHMHVRVGMGTPYLSKEFLDLIKACTDKAKAKEMLAWLYDEDKWPSGFAGGLVTKDPAYRSRYLLFTPRSYEEDQSSATTLDSSAKATRTGNGRLLCCYDIQLDGEGCLESAEVIGEEEQAKGTKWYAYLETPAPNPWYNNQTYVDTLNKKAIDKFIEITYESYLKSIGDDFGKAVPAIFTDEPQFSHKGTLKFAQELSDVTLPWTDDLADTFQAAYHEDLMAGLPQLIWELPEGKISTLRYHYHDHIAERFAQAFADNCGNWCREHGLMLTGHMMEEPTLQSQTAALGEAMRSYRGFDLPGIDMLCDSYEFTTAKQAQSASRQFGRPGVLSELYGVTGWDFDFRGHKLQGDWQAALGVTVRVPHLSWVSMAGEAKRDYPASISYQSPWYKEYPYVEDHFARVNTAMTRGKAAVRVGVIHPVESYWLHWGPADQTALCREQMDQNFQNLAKWLLFGTVDFDFISESLLPIQCKKAGAPLNVGEMSYDVIVVPGCETLRSTTLERLRAFRDKGGRLIFLDKAPSLIDAVPSQEGKALFDRSEQIAFNRSAVMEALANVRDLEIRSASGRSTDNLIYQMRQDGKNRWLFVAHAAHPADPDTAPAEDLRFTLNGCYNVTLYDTITGEIQPVETVTKNNKTRFTRTMYCHDSLLLLLEPACTSCQAQGQLTWAAHELKGRGIPLPKTVEYSLEEPNALVLDMAEFALDEGEFQPEEEILRLDNICRSQLGWPSRMDAVAQPWVLPDDPVVHTVKLKIHIESTVALSGLSLALEDAERVEVRLNGMPASNTVTGYLADRDIQTISLPELREGDNLLELSVPFGPRTNVEVCYLLGDFGVKVNGRKRVLIPRPAELGFGDISSQGLAYYGGNLTYKVPFETKGGRIALWLPHYRGSLVRATLDGTDCGRIVYSPYQLILEDVAPGKHILSLKLFGNRFNTFGQLHLAANSSYRWYGPNSYRTTGDLWCYEYRTRPTGILASPMLIELED